MKLQASDSMCLRSSIFALISILKNKKTPNQKNPPKPKKTQQLPLPTKKPPTLSSVKVFGFSRPTVLRCHLCHILNFCCYLACVSTDRGSLQEDCRILEADFFKLKFGSGSLFVSMWHFIFQSFGYEKLSI